jgi:hypothetical protein
VFFIPGGKIVIEDERIKDWGIQSMGSTFHPFSRDFSGLCLPKFGYSYKMFSDSNETFAAFRASKSKDFGTKMFPWILCIEMPGEITF